MHHGSRGTGLLTAALVATFGIVLSAKAATHAPNVFESGYEYLALFLDAPPLCDRISPQTVEHGPIFGNSDMRIRYLQSMCFYNLALQRQDASLCQRVRTISAFLRDGSGVSEARCRERVADGPRHMGGDYGTGMLLGVMGYPDDEIRKVFPDHPVPDRAFEFKLHVVSRNELRRRIERLPDFSRGDAEAIRQVYEAMPQCASRTATSFECRRLRCGLERAQAGALGCEGALERERSPWE